MTDHADQETLTLADDIRRKQQRDKEEVEKKVEEEWYKSKLGKYYKERYYSGAHDEAFKVFWVRDIDWCHYLKVDEISFAHIGHFHMGESSITYRDKHKFEGEEPSYEEITLIDFLGYLQKFLELTGWKQKLESETDH